eukprot:SAG11_NODE_14065_length_626_cov_1.493359_1_plen_78_part_00
MRVRALSPIAILRILLEDTRSGEESGAGNEEDEPALEESLRTREMREQFGNHHLYNHISEHVNNGEIEEHTLSLEAE